MTDRLERQCSDGEKPLHYALGVVLEELIPTANQSMSKDQSQAIRFIDVHARSDRRDRMWFVAVPLEVLMIYDEPSRRDLESSVWTYPRDSFELIEPMKSLDHGLCENVLAFEYFQDTGHRRDSAQPSTTLSLCAFKD